jgi:hypothetical protein
MSLNFPIDLVLHSNRIAIVADGQWWQETKYTEVDLIALYAVRYGVFTFALCLWWCLKLT